MRKILIALFSLPILGTFLGVFLCFAPFPIAERIHTGVQNHLNHLSNSKQISTGERLQLATLYGSMIAVGRIPFPESADNLAMLFINGDHEDYMLWPNYLALSYSVRAGIAQADKSSSLYKQNISNIQQNRSSRDKRTRHALKWDASKWYSFEPRIAYLYNPWSTRVEDMGLFRRVTIFQWMHFHAGDTPLPPGAPRPFQLTDGTVHNASPDGKLNAFTAYASWLEPNIPHNIPLNLALISHNIMRLIMFGILLVTPILMGVLTFSTHSKRRQVIGRTLSILGTIGVSWAIMRGIWDIALGLSQIASMMGTDSGSLIEPYAKLNGFKTDGRMDSAPSDTLLSPIGWMLWRVAFNFTCYTVCLRIKNLSQTIDSTLPRKEYIIGAICTLFPWIGLPFPLIVIGFPIGLWLLWMVDTDFRRT